VEGSDTGVTGGPCGQLDWAPLPLALPRASAGPLPSVLRMPWAPAGCVRSLPASALGKLGEMSPGCSVSFAEASWEGGGLCTQGSDAGSGSAPRGDILVLTA
jgi:hypothetical protein